MALSYDQVKAALDAATIESGGSFIPFDVNYFVSHYGAQLVGYTGTPLQFYVEQGAARGDLPNAWFDPTYYVAHNRDLAPLLSSADLLVQYAKFGVNEGRSPSAALNNFDGARYLRDNPDITVYVTAHLSDFKTIDPATGQPVSDAQAETQGAIAHYIKFGAVEGRTAYDTGGTQIPFTVYPLSTDLADAVTVDAAHQTVNLALNTNDGHTLLTGSHVVADGASNPTLHLTGDASTRISVTNVATQVQGIDLNGDGVIAPNGVENNVSGAGIFTAKNFTIFDGYARNPLNEGDRTNNYLGDLYYDGTGYAGTGAVVPPGSNPTNGNIVLGGLGSDNIFGGLGDDFLAGGAVAPGRFIAQIVNGVQVLVDGLTGKPVASWDPVANLYKALATGATFFTDQLHGGRNADFMFTELSALNNTDGNNTYYDGGNSTDTAAAGQAEWDSGANTQNNDWILLEAHDDNEPVTVDLGGSGYDPTGNIELRDGTEVGELRNIESIDASGNLYGFLNNSNAELGSRVTDDRVAAPVYGTENFSVGSTAQLDIYGNDAANIVIAGYDNDYVDGANGDDILFGGNLGFLEQYKNNPNLLDAKGGLHLNVSAVGTVNDGKDELYGDSGNDSIVFEMDGGIINGGYSAPIDPQNRKPTATVVATGDTLYADSFSTGRLDGATYTATTADPSESAAQAAALAKLTTDSVVRFDLGLDLYDGALSNPSGSSLLMYRNYGGADLANNVDLNGWTVHSADNTNYAPGVERTLVTGIESVITTGLGAIDYVAAGTNNPNLVFNNQQNFQALNATVDLRGIDGGNDSGTSRVFGIYTATNFGNRNPDDNAPAADQYGVNRADNVLYANTGNDVLEGRGGADFLSGGKGDDDFIFTAGDNTDIIWRQKDANGDNLWDKDASGNYLYTQDFRVPDDRPNQSELDIKLEATNPGNQPTITVDHFAIRVGITEGQPDTGTLVEITDLGTVGDFQQLANELDAKLNLVDPNLHAVWDGPNAFNGVLKITDAIGRNISDTANEGYRFSASFTNLTVTNQAQFVAHPVAQVEDDRLIFESYLDDTNNSRVDTQHSDLTGLNANQLVVGFNTVDGNSTTLAHNQEWRVQFENLRVSDKVSVSINGTVFTSTVKPGESTFVFAERFANEINTVLQLDHNTSAGDVFANHVHTTGQTSDDDGVLVLTQGEGCDPLVFMHTPVVSITNTNGATSGTWAIADTSGNSINLYQFDGRNGNLNAEDALFVGTTQDPHNSHATTAPVDINKTAGAIDQSAAIDSKEVLATALDKGGILNGINALIVATDTDPAHEFFNVSTNGKFAALNGDDQLIGGNGDDIISAGTGDDVIIGSAGTDTVDGGGNWVDPTNPGNTITFNDVLLFQESDFVTAANPSASFTITLDPTLSLTPTNAGKVEIAGAASGTTTFTNIEEVRTTSNSANDTLNVVGLSDAIAAKSAPSLENLNSPLAFANEGVNIYLTQGGGDNYTVDFNGDGVLQPSEIHIPITDVCGVENVLAGKANDTVTIDDTQLGSNNKIDLGSQENKVEAGGQYTLADQGFDLVTYVQNDTIKTAVQLPVTTFTVESAAETDTLTSTGGVLGTKTVTDTLVNVEQVSIAAGIIAPGETFASATAGTQVDVLDVSSLASGATVNYGSNVTVMKSQGGANAATSVANVDANTLSAGGVSATGTTGLGLEKVIIDGIQSLEHVKGGAGNDRVIVGNNLETGIIPAALITKATDLGAANTVQAIDIGLYQFDLGAGLNSLDYYQETSFVSVTLDTAGTAPDWVLVGNPAGGLTGANERIDYATNVQQYYGTGSSLNGINLAGSTVDTTIEFSKYSKLHSNEIAEPNGNNGTDTTDLTRGILVSNTADSSIAYATFVDRTAVDTTALTKGAVVPDTNGAFWTVVGGSEKAEKVIFSDNELANAQHYTLNLASGLNVVDYSNLNTTASVSATIGGVNTTNANWLQTVETSNATVNQFHNGANGRDANVLTVVATSHAGDQLNIGGLDNGNVAANGQAIVGQHFSSLQNVDFLSSANPPAQVPPLPATVQAAPVLIYNLVDLSAQKVVEAVNGWTSTNGVQGNANGTELGFVTNVIGFENINNAGNTVSGHLYGDGNVNAISAGNGGDWIYGATGSSGTGLDQTSPGGDQLTAGDGTHQDLFIYRSELDSPGAGIGAAAGDRNQDPSRFDVIPSDNAKYAQNLVKAQDAISNFHAGVDKLVFDVSDSYDSIKVAANATSAAPHTVNVVASAGAGSIFQIDISKDSAQIGTNLWKAADNYTIVDSTGATISATDVVLNVATTGAVNRLDAANGSGPAGNPNDLVTVFDYTDAGQSQGASSDAIFNFTVLGAQSDKIDLSFLKLEQGADVLVGSSTTAIAAGGALDGADAIAQINVFTGPTIAINAPLDNVFRDGGTATGTERAIVVQDQLSVSLGPYTAVFIDANHDGNYNPGQDMAITLVGVVASQVNLNDFIFNHQG